MGWAPLLHAQTSDAQSSLETHIDSSHFKGHFSKQTWSLTSGFESRTEGKDEGFASLLRAKASFIFPFTKSFKLEAEPYVEFYSSRVQQRFDDDSYQDRFGLSYAHLGLTPLEGLEIRGGAISQSHISNSQLISGYRSFPGGFAEYSRTLTQGLQVGLRGQYVVPTSSSLNTERESKEELPLFQTQSVFLNFNDEKDISARVQMGRFQWSDLPAKIAFDSTRAGNTTSGDGSFGPESKLRYEYAGWFGSFDGAYTFFNDLKAGARFKRFQNQKAPANLADSQWMSLYGSYPLGNYGFEFEIGSFFSEGDSSISRYASSGKGNTNRKGEEVSAKLDLKKYQFFLSAVYTKANLINSNSYQDNMTNLQFMVETYAFQF